MGILGGKLPLRESGRQDPRVGNSFRRGCAHLILIKKNPGTEKSLPETRRFKKTDLTTKWHMLYFSPWINSWHLTLLAPGDVPPCHAFAYNRANTSEIPTFHKGGFLQAGSNASRPTKKFKSQTLFWRVLGIQTSWILLNMVNHSTASHFQKELDP